MSVSHPPSKTDGERQASLNLLFVVEETKLPKSLPLLHGGTILPNSYSGAPVHRPKYMLLTARK